MNINYFQKSLLILYFSIITLIAMEDNKVIIPIKKSIFIPTDNTPQANTDLLAILENIKNKNFQEKDWEKIKKCLKNGADPNFKTSDYSQTPIICLAIQYNRKDLFDYLLQLGADINIQDGCQWTPLHTFILIRPINFCIEDLLKNGANTNAMTTFYDNIPIPIHSISPISLAIQKKHFDFIRPLIEYKANVNYKNSINQPPLRLAIDSENNDVIGQLCDAGAPVINLDNYNHPHTVFHLVAKTGVAEPEKVLKIKTLMTHINFKNNDNEKIKNTIKTVLLIFNRLSHPLKSKRQENVIKFPIIPHEIQIFILSKLLSANFFHQGLYKQCKGENYQQLPIKLINEHIEYLKQILQMKNCYNQTALDILPKKDPYAFAYGYRTDAEKLLEGTTLQEDFYILHKVYPNLSSISENNLALQILENHYTFEPK